MISHFVGCTSEYQAGFLFEKRTKAYKSTLSGASQKKIMTDARIDLLGWALPKLERQGV